MTFGAVRQASSWAVQLMLVADAEADEIEELLVAAEVEEAEAAKGL